MSHQIGKVTKLQAETAVEESGNGSSERQWWDAQREADEKFQAALRRAGAKQGANPNPGTDKPRQMGRAVEALASGGFVFPPAGD